MLTKEEIIERKKQEVELLQLVLNGIKKVKENRSLKEDLNSVQELEKEMENI